MLTAASDSQQLVARDKELKEIITAAYIDNKTTRAIIAKCDIERAIVTIRNNLKAYSLKSSGNILFAVSKVVYKRTEMLSHEVKDSLQLIYKTQVGAKKKVARKSEVAAKKEALARETMGAEPFLLANLSSPGTDSLEEISRASIERPRNIAQVESVTQTGQRSIFRDISLEATNQIAGTRAGFLEEISKTTPISITAVADSTKKSATKLRLGDFSKVPTEEKPVGRALDFDLGVDLMIPGDFGLDQGLEFPADTSIFGFRDGEESAEKRAERRLQNINAQLDNYLDSYRRQYNVISEAEQEDSDLEAERERKPKPRKKSKVDEKTTLEEREIEANSLIRQKWSFTSGKKETTIPEERTSPEEFISNITDENIRTLAHNLQISRETEITESVLEPEEPKNVLDQIEDPWPDYEEMHVEEEKKHDPTDMSFGNVEETGVREAQAQKQIERTSYFETENRVMKAVGRGKEAIFSRILETEGRKEKARVFYDLLSLVNDGKVTLYQPRALADITITVT